MLIEGRLVDGAGPDYVGYQVVLAFTQRVVVPTQESPRRSGESGPRERSEPLWVPAEAHGLIDRDGSFTIELPDKQDLRDPLTLRVLAPNGIVSFSGERTVASLAENVVITVAPQPALEAGRSKDPFLGRRARLSGRAIDPAGEKLLSDLQVVLWGRPAEAQTEGFEAVLVARTDSHGYFSGDYPRGSFEEAFATVADSQKVPINLEGGTFPQRVVVAVDLHERREQPHDDCSCHSPVPRAPDAGDLTASPGAYSDDFVCGTCVCFTTPNRTLEEFDFYTVVRTTEPQIKGLTMRETPRLAPDVLAGILGIPQKALVPHVNGGEGHELKLSPNPGVIESLAALPSKTLRAVNPALLKQLTGDPDGLTSEAIATATKATVFDDLVGLMDALKKTVPGRATLTAQNPVDWDDTPTFYQATTIAHGHLLHLKQVWKADGYSLGDLLYSLPLAPCQKKQIAVIDWDRREQAARTELLEEEEQLEALLSHDRDISEIVKSTLKEKMRGGSESSEAGIAGGFGGAASGSGSAGGILSLGIGADFGTSAGAGGASSSAWQNSSRRLAASSLQELHDRTMQSASALRSQRSTVIQTVGQGEAVRAQTEVVANHNHCHAITMEYFEVLRHFQVSQELVDVQECLFVPFLMSPFDDSKALRWRESLSGYLRNRRLWGGFAAIERIRNHYEGSDLPLGRYAEETLEFVDGELRVSFSLVRPNDSEDDEYDAPAWSLFEPFLSDLNGSSSVFNLFFDGRTPAERDRIFQSEVAPSIAEAFLQDLSFWVVGTDGEFEVKLDPTLVTSYATNEPLYVSLRPAGAVPAVAREWVTRFEIRPGDAPLPPNSKAIVRTGSVRYRTKHLTHFLFQDSRIDNDLRPGDPAQIPTFLDRRELRNPREEDKELRKQLLAHLNEHIEWYHKVIWWSIDKERRYMLLDGFVAPSAGGRSVASVVENKLIGIVGNCLVMPVARGFHLDPTYDVDGDEPFDLLEHYAPETPIAPSRISVPTRGVFGEAVMGSCNSCEEKDDMRFWRFEESPCGDEPTPIQPVSTESRRAEPGDLKPSPFPAPMINLQNAPPVPDPTGLGAALQLLGTPNIFRDITGLELTQKNAMAAMQAAMEAAQHFADNATKLASQKGMAQNADKAMQTMDKMKRENKISDADVSRHSNAIMDQFHGGTDHTAEQSHDPQQVMQALQSPLTSGGQPIEQSEAAYAAGWGPQTVEAKLSYGGSGTATPAVTCVTRQPASPDTLVVDGYEYPGPVADFLNWRAGNNVFHGLKQAPPGEQQCRPLDQITAIVLHETVSWNDNPAGDRWYRPESPNLATQFFVQTDGSIAQHYDVVQYVQHAGPRNRHSIGIEFVNEVWVPANRVAGGSFTPPLPARDRTPRQVIQTDPDWGAFSYYVVPPPNQLEALKALLDYLLDAIPSVPTVWAGLVGYPYADDNLFLISSLPELFGCDEPFCNRAGVYCHYNLGAGHTDGSFLALYTWLRHRGLDAGDAPGSAYATAIDLVRNAASVPPPPQQPRHRYVDVGPYL